MKTILIVGACVLVSALFSIGGYYLYSGWPKTTESWIGLGILLGQVVSPVIAFSSLVGALMAHHTQKKWREMERERSQSEARANQALLCLERAFQVITNDEKREAPEKDRLEWLTCGRWLLISQKFASKIATDDINEIFTENQEYWRTRFYDFFKPTDIHGFASNLENFQESRLGAGDALEPRSVTAIYKFMEWPVARPDPIEEQEVFTQHELERMRVHRRGLREYFERRRN